MRHAAALVLVCSFGILTPDPSYAAKKPEGLPLKIFFIDVEGGQSTLIVTPIHQSLLVDTGWAGNGIGYRPGNPHLARDANRILATAHEAGVSVIDDLLITHFHIDHVGGVGELSQMLPIRTFIDHGSPAPELLSKDADHRNAFTVYSSIRSGEKHLEPHVGDQLPVRGVEVKIVSTDGKTLVSPLPRAGGANTACVAPAVPTQDTLENPRSTGFRLRYGEFTFVDLGDLSGAPLRRLVCPKSLIGRVDVYLVSHHGGADEWDPAVIAGFQPRVAIVNNGLHKGGARKTFETLHRVDGIENVWQLHLSERAADLNYPAEFVANLDESTAYRLALEAYRDGSFDVINSRTGERKHYATASLAPR